MRRRTTRIISPSKPARVRLKTSSSRESQPRPRVVRSENRFREMKREELYAQIKLQGGFADLSARAKFQLGGADRIRFLNGQVSNDVRRASNEEAIYAC